MKILPLYAERPRSPLEVVKPRSLNPSCGLCTLAAQATNRCVGADGEAGGLLVVGEGPGRVEDRQNRPFVGKSGALLRKLIGQYWDGPVALDNATRCCPGKVEVKPKHIEACRPYLAQTFLEVNPTRVIALGSKSFTSVLGRQPAVYSVRRGYGWIQHPEADEPVPVWMVAHPAAALRNRHVMKWFREDLKRALTTEPDFMAPFDATFSLIETVDDARAACEQIRLDAPWFSFDCETAGIPLTEFFEVCSLGICPSGDDEAYVWSREALEDPAIRQPLIELLEDPSIGKVGHNIKFDAGAVWYAWQCEVQGIYGDSQLWRKLEQAHVLGRLEVAEETVGMGGAKKEHDEALNQAAKMIAKARRQKKQTHLPGITPPPLLAAVRYPDESYKRFAYGLTPPAVRHRYVARDTVASARICDDLTPHVTGEGQFAHIWTQVVRDAPSTIGQIQRWGIAASRSAIDNFQQFVQMQQDEVAGRFEPYDNFDPNNPDSVAKLLFDRIGLPVIRETEKGHRSTDKNVLHKLKGKHPIVDDLVEYRRLGKLLSSYGNTMAGFIRSDGRIHPYFKLDGTETGRLSCEDPALHQTPRAGTAEGKMVRDCFIPEDPSEYEILQVDFGQLELRVARMLSGDPVMLEMFRSGEDFHTATAKLIAPIYWGIDPSQVTKYHRSIAKAFNFGLLYGMTDGGMAYRLGCSKADAARLRAAIMGKWKVLAKWMKECQRYARKHGHCWTWWEGKPARRRDLHKILDKEKGLRINAENSAINTPVQGTASDYCLASLNKIVPWVKNSGVPAKVILTVHDSILFEVRKDATMDVAKEAVKIMTSFDSKDTPLVVDAEVGPAWGSLAKLDLTA